MSTGSGAVGRKCTKQLLVWGVLRCRSGIYKYAMECTSGSEIYALAYA